MRRSAGFTLIELLIVVTVIAIVLAIAIPNLIGARITANETAALSTLRSIGTAQAQIQASAAIDLDADGAGEFGFFRELSGGFGIRTSADGSSVGGALAPSVLSGSFGDLNAHGTISRSGYMFRISLPASDGLAVNETAAAAFAGNPVGTDLAETTWCAMTWPAAFETTGRRSYFLNQSGEILATEESTYVGPSPGFLSGAAFLAPGNLSSLTGSLAIGTTGRDGNRWNQVN